MFNRLAIIIPTRNSAEFLEYTLQSLGAAVCTDLFDVYVFDQSSTDATHDIVKSHFPHVRWHQQVYSFAERGEAEMRNRALKIVRDSGQYSHFMQIDSDELIVDGWLSTLISIIEKHDPGCIRSHYYQLIGLPWLSQVGNPIEQRRIVYKLTDKVEWLSRADANYHCYMQFDEPIYDAGDSFAYIHLGYCRKDMRQRLVDNIKRGDWNLDPSLVNERIQEVQENPWQYLPDVEAFPVHIEKRSLPLNRLCRKYSVDYQAYAKLDSTPKGYYRIKDIIYGT